MAIQRITPSGTREMTRKTAKNRRPMRVLRYPSISSLTASFHFVNVASSAQNGSGDLRSGVLRMAEFALARREWLAVLPDALKIFPFHIALLFDAKPSQAQLYQNAFIGRSYSLCVYRKQRFSFFLSF